MVASLAPNKYSMGRLNTSPTTVRIRPTITIMAKEFPIIASASSLFPLPRSMEQRGAPPIPKRLAKAMTMDITGRQSPNPVSESVA